MKLKKNKGYAEIGFLVLLIAVIIAILVGLSQCNSQPTAAEPVVLPNGEVVKHYTFVRAGTTHHIYVSEGNTTSTDNYRSGKVQKHETTIEK